MGNLIFFTVLQRQKCVACNANIGLLYGPLIKALVLIA